MGGKRRGSRDNQYRFLAYRGSGEGKAVPDTGDPTHHGGLGGVRTLEPGKSFTSIVALDKWFQFDAPDTYRITGIFELEFHEPGSQHNPIWNDFTAGDRLVRVVPKD